MWNSEIYEKFKNNRIQPSIDLTNRIELNNCKRIIDIGCGSGMSTIVLRKKWESAEIIGVDYSENMLNKAKERIEDVTWIKKDCSKPIKDLGKFDIVFSNAFLQWIKNQEEFLVNTRDIISENGILAMQIPAFDQMIASAAIRQGAESFNKELFKGIENENCHNMSLGEYYDILDKYYSDVEIWQTNYQHIMESHQAIIEFLSGTALNPYFSRLDEEQKQEFLKVLTEKIKKTYSIQKNGKILFEFKRIFILAKK